MNLNTIQLTTTHLVDFYATHLVETEPKPAAAPITLSYLGNNAKHILIITNTENDKFITEKALQFLTSVLAACKLQLADVAILNWKNWKGTGTDLQNSLESKTVLLFNIDPVTFGLPLNFPPFQTQKFDNRIYLFAPSLEEIEMDTNLKKQLWTSLKKLFQL